jgi:hypothetical protein
MVPYRRLNLQETAVRNHLLDKQRDKIAASKKKGMLIGSSVALGYEARDRKLVVSEAEAVTVRLIFPRISAPWKVCSGSRSGCARTTSRAGAATTSCAVYTLLHNPHCRLTLKALLANIPMNWLQQSIP